MQKYKGNKFQDKSKKFQGFLHKNKILIVLKPLILYYMIFCRRGIKSFETCPDEKSHFKERTIVSIIGFCLNTGKPEPIIT